MTVAANRTKSTWSFLLFERVPLTGRLRLRITSFVPFIFDNVLGDIATLLSICHHGILEKDHPLAQIVERVGSHLSDAAETHRRLHKIPLPRHRHLSLFTFHVLNSPLPGAFAAPGGRIFIHAGMFQSVKTADELACILGHEMAHCISRHWIEGIFLDGAISVLNTLFAFPLHAMTATFSFHNQQLCEFEADRIGSHLAASAGYDPSALMQVLR
jgi:predicted Zn-dependent protease